MHCVWSGNSDLLVVDYVSYRAFPVLLVKMLQEFIDCSLFATEARHINRSVTQPGHGLQCAIVKQKLDHLLIALIRCPVKRGHPDLLGLEVDIRATVEQDFDALEAFCLRL